MAFRPLVTVFANLYRLHFGDADKAELDALIADCLEAADSRNRLVHSLWVTAISSARDERRTTRVKLTASVKKDFAIKTEFVTRAQIVALANELAALDVRIRTFNTAKISARYLPNAREGAHGSDS
jgi:hypothetical protein